jgi:hypothetical protein
MSRPYYEILGTQVERPALERAHVSRCVLQSPSGARARRCLRLVAASVPDPQSDHVRRVGRHIRSVMSASRTRLSSRSRSKSAASAKISLVPHRATGSEKSGVTALGRGPASSALVPSGS